MAPEFGSPRGRPSKGLHFGVPPGRDRPREGPLSKIARSVSNIVICLWHFEGAVERVAIRLRPGAGHEMFITLSGVLNFIALERHSGSLPHR